MCVPGEHHYTGAEQPESSADEPQSTEQNFAHYVLSNRGAPTILFLLLLYYLNDTLDIFIPRIRQGAVLRTLGRRRVFFVGIIYKIICFQTRLVLKNWKLLTSQSRLRELLFPDPELEPNVVL